MSQFLETTEWASLGFTNTYTSTPIADGFLYLLEDTVGVCMVADKFTQQGVMDTLDVEWNEDGVLIYQADKIRVAKAAVAMAPGQAVYWSGVYGAGVTNVWASGLYRIGICVKEAAAADADVLIHLEGHMVTQEAAP